MGLKSQWKRQPRLGASASYGTARRARLLGQERIHLHWAIGEYQEMKAVSAHVVSCCVCDKPKKIASHAWQHSIHV